MRNSNMLKRGVSLCLLASIGFGGITAFAHPPGEGDEEQATPVPQTKEAATTTALGMAAAGAVGAGMMGGLDPRTIVAGAVVGAASGAVTGTIQWLYRTLDIERRFGMACDEWATWLNREYHGFSAFDDAMARLDRSFAEIKGQDEAKSVAKGAVQSFLTQLAANRIKEQRGETPTCQGTFLYLTGAPGTGKSTMARMIKDALLSDDESYLEITPNAIASADAYMKLKDKIFGIECPWGQSHEQGPQKTPGLLAFWRRHSGANVVYIEELDKMADPDAKLPDDARGKRPYDGSFGEVIRSHVSDGKVSSSPTSSYDTRNCFMIASGNESPDSLIAKQREYETSDAAASDGDVKWEGTALKRVLVASFRPNTDTAVISLVDTKLQDYAATLKDAHGWDVDFDQSAKTAIIEHLKKCSGSGHAFPILEKNSLSPVFAEVTSAYVRASKSSRGCKFTVYHDGTDFRIRNTDIAANSMQVDFHPPEGWEKPHAWVLPKDAIDLKEEEDLGEIDGIVQIPPEFIDKWGVIVWFTGMNGEEMVSVLETPDKDGGNKLMRIPVGYTGAYDETKVPAWQTHFSAVVGDQPLPEAVPVPQGSRAIAWDIAKRAARGAWDVTKRASGAAWDVTKRAGDWVADSRLVCTISRGMDWFLESPKRHAGIPAKWCGS